MTDLELLNDVIAELDGGRNWCPDGSGDHLDTAPRYCVAVTVNNVAYSRHRGSDVRPLFEEINTVIREQYADRVHPRSLLPIATFNDHPDTVWPDIELVLDKTRARLEEQL